MDPQDFPPLSLPGQFPLALCWSHRQKWDVREDREQDPIPGVKLSEAELKNRGPTFRRTGPKFLSDKGTPTAESGPGEGPLRTWPTVQLFRQVQSCDSSVLPRG